MRNHFSSRGVSLSGNRPEDYPLSFPYRAPAADVDRREERLRRWTYCLLAAAALLLVVLVAGVVVLFRFLNQAATPASADSRVLKDDGKGFKQPVDDRIERDKKPTAQGRDVAQVDEKPVAAFQPEQANLDADRAQQPAAQAEAASSAQRELFLQTIAVLTVGHLYQSYLNLGLLDDDLDHEVRERTEAVRLLAEITNTLNVVDRQLGKLAASRLGTEDRKDLARVRKVSQLLRDQAKELKSYWDEPTPPLRAQYRQARQATWAAIKPLLGIENETE